MRFDEAFSAAVAERVAAIERQTDAEIVVVAVARADDWDDRSELFAAVLTLALGGALLFAPFVLHPAGFFVDLVVGWALLRWIGGRASVLRLITTSRERHQRVELAAKRIFVEEAVHGTPNRTGVLVLVAGLEREVALVPDLGAAGCVPAGELVAARDAFRQDDLTHLLVGLDALGAALARHVPWSPASDGVDLPNAPRVRA